eukprot:1141870-Pelagomonas_calceolata.AAC.2
MQWPACYALLCAISALLSCKDKERSRECVIRASGICGPPGQHIPRPCPESGREGKGLVGKGLVGKGRVW